MSDYPSGGNPPTDPQNVNTAHITVPATTRSQLPFTGSDVGGLVGIGLVCVIAGTALVRRARRKLA